MGFSLDRVPAIIQEVGALDRIGPLAARLGRGAPALLIADPGLAFFGLTPRAEASLRGAGLSVSVYTSIKSDPATSQIDTAVALAQMDGAGVVVALGGGSAMDAGKAVAAIAGGSLSAAAYATPGAALPERALAKICVPTTSGTGSETTRGAVLTLPDGTRLRLWSDSLKADAVLLDPTLTVDQSGNVTAATGMDALVHALEACTTAHASYACDMFCHAAIGLVGRHLPAAVERPADLAARAGLQWAAALSGVPAGRPRAGHLPPTTGRDVRRPPRARRVVRLPRAGGPPRGVRPRRGGVPDLAAGPVGGTETAGAAAPGTAAGNRRILRRQALSRRGMDGANPAHGRNPPRRDRSVKPESAAFLAKAHRLLREARTELDVQLPEACGRAAYLAALQAAHAYIHERTGRVARSHKGAHNMFFLLSADEPRIDADLRVFLSEGYDLKNSADYEVGDKGDVPARGGRRRPGHRRPLCGPDRRNTRCLRPVRGLIAFSTPSPRATSRA